MDLVRSAIDTATSLHVRIRDCRALLLHAEGYANSRWLRDVKCFRDVCDEIPDKPHVVNTSTAVAVIARFPQIFRLAKIEAFNGLDLAEVCKFYSNSYSKQGTTGYWPSKNTNEWSPYVSSLALAAIAESAMANTKGALENILKDMPALKDAISCQAKKLREYLDRWALHSLEREHADYDHPFFAYTAWSALSKLSSVCPESTKDLGKSEKSLLMRFRYEFYSQMTFRLADVVQHLDATVLILSLYCLTFLANDKSQLPSDVVDAALSTIFSLQQSSGFWSTSTPLLGSSTGRVGCSTIELANCLLRIPRLVRRFDQFQPQIDRLFNYLLKEFDPLQPERGWSVDIRRDGNARQTWYGFLVYEFINLYAQKMSEEAAGLILRGFRYTKDTPKYTWDQIPDYDGLKAQIERAVIQPRKSEAKGVDAKCSIIFFGPPGTGKTTIANALAYQLGWGMIEIGPGEFLINGIEGIFAQGDLIFQRLLMLDGVVVLFDEVDELVQARDVDADKISRFLTTYMLPWIQRLRDRGTIVFIFATNRIEVFDPAIRRLGRFDLVLPLGPPQGKERARIMKAMSTGLSDEQLEDLSANGIPPQATIGEIADAVKRCLRSREAVSSETIAKNLKPVMSGADWEKFIAAKERYKTVLMP